MLESLIFLFPMTHVACSTFKNSQFFEKMKDPQISVQKVDHVRNMGVVPFFSTSNESCRMVKIQKLTIFRQKERPSDFGFKSLITSEMWGLLNKFFQPCTKRQETPSFEGFTETWYGTPF